jgi:hypothetical protein
MTWGFENGVLQINIPLAEERAGVERRASMRLNIRRVLRASSDRSRAASCLTRRFRC